jgi:hypothetical protein
MDWEQLFRKPLKGGRLFCRKDFTLEFQWVKNKEYDHLCRKISRLLLKKRALPVKAITKRQVLNEKIRNLRESRKTIPTWV